MRTLFLASVLCGLSACDYSGDWLFAGSVDGVLGVDHLGEIEIASVVNRTDVDGAVIYGEIGPTGTADRGGVTFNFRGTGDHVCIFIDPELVFWNQSVSVTSPRSKWSWPDNVLDDGDLDLSAGLATYYNGTPAKGTDGGEIGDFRVRYEDELNQEITVPLSECLIPGKSQDAGGHSGRGTPEYCTIRNTLPGVSYMVLMETWSTPLDDDRLSYGLLVTHGDCNDLFNAAGGGEKECLITGEARDASGAVLPDSEEFEALYCDSSLPMSDYCELELQQVQAGQKDCAIDHCYCSNPDDGSAY